MEMGHDPSELTQVRVVVLPQRNDKAQWQGLIIVTDTQRLDKGTASFWSAPEDEELLKLIEHDNQLVCIAAETRTDQAQEYVQGEVMEEPGPRAMGRGGNTPLDGHDRVFVLIIGMNVKRQAPLTNEVRREACVEQGSLAGTALGMKHCQSITKHRFGKLFRRSLSSKEDRLIFEAKRIQKLIGVRWHGHPEDRLRHVSFVGRDRTSEVLLQFFQIGSGVDRVADKDVTAS